MVEFRVSARVAAVGTTPLNDGATSRRALNSAYLRDAATFAGTPSATSSAAVITTAGPWSAPLTADRASPFNNGIIGCFYARTARRQSFAARLLERT